VSAARASGRDDPERVYHDATLIDTQRLSSLQKELVDCLLTRNHDGFVRQKHLERIIGSENVWIPPFLIRLVGEYVLEIFDLIDQNRGNPNVSIYPEFVRSNRYLLRSQSNASSAIGTQDIATPVWVSVRTRETTILAFG